MEACAKYCDVVTLDIYPPVDLEKGVVLRAGTDLADMKGDTTERELFPELDRIGRILDKPLHVTEWSFPSVEGGFPCVNGGGMRFRTQHERALASRLFAEMMNASPSIAGYNYFMWVDLQNRPTTQACGYGLLNEAGEPYAELVKMFEEFHAGADAARKKGYPPRKRLVPPPGPVSSAADFAARKIPGASGRTMLDVFDFTNVTIVLIVRDPANPVRWDWRRFALGKPVAETTNGNTVCRTYRIESPRGKFRFALTLRNWFRTDCPEALSEVVSVENFGEKAEFGTVFWRFNSPKPPETLISPMPPKWCTWRPWVDLSFPWNGHALHILSPENSTYGETLENGGRGVRPPDLGYSTACTLATGETWRPKDAAYYIFRIEDARK
jgi:hypothetical protein